MMNSAEEIWFRDRKCFLRTEHSHAKHSHFGHVGFPLRNAASCDRTDSLSMTGVFLFFGPICSSPRKSSCVHCLPHERVQSRSSLACNMCVFDIAGGKVAADVDRTALLVNTFVRALLFLWMKARILVFFYTRYCLRKALPVRVPL